jgi:predicted MFS family arabinose efflux permease
MGALRERNFRLVFIGQTVSAVGNTLVPVALSFAVLDLTGSADDLGLVLGSGAIVMVAFMLIGGVIADRLPRQAMMIAADTCRCGSQLALGVLLVADRPSVLMLAGLTAMAGAAAALFTPAAAGLTPALVRPAYLQQANALQQTTTAAAGIAGPAVAGLLVVTVGPGWAIVADAVTFAVSAGLLLRLRLTQAPRQERQHWIRDLRDGWTDFWGRIWFRAVTLSFAGINLLYAAYLVLGPLASRRYYDGAETWAAVCTASGVGAMIAGLVAARLRPHYPLRAAVLFALLGGLAPVAFSARMPVWVVACGAALDGAGIVLFESLWQTTVQRHIPEQMLSRASSYDYFASYSAIPVGLAIAAPVAGALGLRPVLLMIAVGSFLLVLATLAVSSVRHLPATAGQTEPAGQSAPGLAAG